jgi:DNA-binding NarL/FixJ family response regulator
MTTNAEQFKIIIADDHVSVREGLAGILNSNPNFIVQDVVSNGMELKRAVEQQHPHLVITDIRMPDGDGLKIGGQLKARYPHLGLIAYTGFYRENVLLSILKAGFDGFVLKQSAKEEVLLAASMVLNGYQGFCNDSQRRVNRLIDQNYYNPVKPFVKMLLNERYVSIINYIAMGMTSEEIAKEMGLGIQTIHTYRKRALIKTGCNNPASLVQYAHIHGLLDADE